jgi:hypothetical protein
MDKTKISKEVVTSGHGEKPATGTSIYDTKDHPLGGKIAIRGGYTTIIVSGDKRAEERYLETTNRRLRGEYPIHGRSAGNTTPKSTSDTGKT